MPLSITIEDAERTYVECLYAECHYDKYSGANFISVIFFLVSSPVFSDDWAGFIERVSFRVRPSAQNLIKPFFFFHGYTPEKIS
jgi:hypothetical protein